MRLLDEIAEWARNRKRPNQKVLVECDGDGITQFTAGPDNPVRVHLDWDRVLAVYGFKRDCFTTDQICLLMGDNESNRWIEVREDDIGYKTLVEQLLQRVQGFPPESEWWKQVALPAFEAQWTELYRRPDHQDQR